MTVNLRKYPAVLVVEDEPLVRLCALEIVTDSGFAPLEATSAHEAIAILESRDDVGVIFTDINICGPLDGLQLAHLITERWPPVRIIVTSGYPLAGENRLPPGALFFRKPYEASEISRALHGLSA